MVYTARSVSEERVAQSVRRRSRHALTAVALALLVTGSCVLAVDLAAAGLRSEDMVYLLNEFESVDSDRDGMLGYDELAAHFNWSRVDTAQDLWIGRDDLIRGIREAHYQPRPRPSEGFTLRSRDPWPPVPSGGKHYRAVSRRGRSAPAGDPSPFRPATYDVVPSPWEHSAGPAPDWISLICACRRQAERRCRTAPRCVHVCCAQKSL